MMHIKRQEKAYGSKTVCEFYNNYDAATKETNFTETRMACYSQMIVV